MKFSEVLGLTNFKPFSLGKYEKKICHQKSTEFFTLGGGGTNAKFHHPNLLGAALSKNVHALFPGKGRTMKEKSPTYHHCQIHYRLFFFNVGRAIVFYYRYRYRFLFSGIRTFHMTVETFRGATRTPPTRTPPAGPTPPAPTQLNPSAGPDFDPIST